MFASVFTSHLGEDKCFCKSRLFLQNTFVCMFKKVVIFRFTWEWIVCSFYYIIDLSTTVTVQQYNMGLIKMMKKHSFFDGKFHEVESSFPVVSWDSNQNDRLQLCKEFTQHMIAFYLTVSVQWLKMTTWFKMTISLQAWYNNV